jgi:hypothetical protein
MRAAMPRRERVVCCLRANALMRRRQISPPDDVALRHAAAADFSRPPCCRRLTFYTAALRRVRAILRQRAADRPVRAAVAILQQRPAALRKAPPARAVADAARRGAALRADFTPRRYVMRVLAKRCRYARERLLPDAPAVVHAAEGVRHSSAPRATRCQRWRVDPMRASDAASRYDRVACAAAVDALSRRCIAATPHAAIFFFFFFFFFAIDIRH